MNRFRWLGPLVFLLAIFASSGVARGQAGTASVFGDIKDQQSANLPGATVTLTSLDTGAARTTVTSETGAYRFVGVCLPASTRSRWN